MSDESQGAAAPAYIEMGDAHAAPADDKPVYTPDIDGIDAAAVELDCDRDLAKRGTIVATSRAVRASRRWDIAVPGSWSETSALRTKESRALASTMNPTGRVYLTARV